jgi:transposase-like protein
VRHEIGACIDRHRQRAGIDGLMRVEKLRIVAEIEWPGSGIAEIARRYEVSRGLRWNWRSQVRRGVLRPEPAPALMFSVLQAILRAELTVL